MGQDAEAERPRRPLSKNLGYQVSNMSVAAAAFGSVMGKTRSRAVGISPTSHRGPAGRARVLYNNQRPPDVGEAIPDSLV